MLLLFKEKCLHQGIIFHIWVQNVIFKFYLLLIHILWKTLSRRRSCISKDKQKKLGKESRDSTRAGFQLVFSDVNVHRAPWWRTVTQSGQTKSGTTPSPFVIEYRLHHPGGKWSELKLLAFWLVNYCLRFEALIRRQWFIRRSLRSQWKKVFAFRFVECFWNKDFAWF